MRTQKTVSAHVATDRGYAHPAYAASLQEFGRPVRLLQSEGAVLARPVPGGTHEDAMGPYPLFVCDDWSRLPHDLEATSEQWVSLTVVVDPFGPPAETFRQQGFDVVRPYKQHYLIDLNVSYNEATSKHHRYYARRAGREGVQTRRVTSPTDHVDLWTRLYAYLIERHDITGLQAFSRQAFETQLGIPGMTMFVASVEDEPVAAHLWYEMGDVAYSHLAAQNETGYDLSASYALHKAALDHFRPSPVQWLSLGGGLESGADSSDGLSRFKRQWATTSAPSLLCGRILRPDVYASLTASAEAQDADYFPAYRAGEMT